MLFEVSTILMHYSSLFFPALARLYSIDELLRLSTRSEGQEEKGNEGEEKSQQKAQADQNHDRGDLALRELKKQPDDPNQRPFPPHLGSNTRHPLWLAQHDTHFGTTAVAEFQQDGRMKPKIEEETIFGKWALFTRDKVP
ncbi:hypothetical protein WR25_26808 [Diploscapter pachys]|uniref:Uncharacterized protein n=1 Tax=Diploscapter pachys TaxID=2018661 RepID=A0A2A2KKX6_9BILA|nr:hypothetical protein WR25_26808 [Diploscapter pachys]